MERDKINKTISKKPTGVFYIDGNKAFYFEQTLTSPVGLDFPADTVSNFELLNKKKFIVLLQTFIRNYKLIPKNIVILISAQVTFDREFPHGSIEMQKNIQEFLELVPYEELIQRKIVTSGKTRVIATNKEVCDVVKSAFTGAGFLINGIYPLSLVMELIPSLKSNLDLSLFVNKVSELKTINLQPVIEASYASSFEGSISSAPVEKEKPSRTRLYVLAGVFAVLMLVLGYVIYTTIISPSEETQNTLPLPTLAPAPPASINQVAPVEEAPAESTASAQNTSTTSATTGPR